MNNIFGKISRLVKSILKPRGEKRTEKNPWPGLHSYEDPQNTDNPLKFCGREEESEEVFKLVDNNIVITLYGKSGIGKTSLLNAGVFPRLRGENYCPLYVRFESNGIENVSFASQIISKLTFETEKVYGKNAIEIIDVISENWNSQREDFLWSFFARRRFTDGEGRKIFPVIVLDQFEENIRANRAQTILLLKQIAYMSNRQNMLKETLVKDKLYIYDYNFRFIISIREDELYRLEDLLNSSYLTSLKTGRYRLKNLSSESAKSIICTVGSDIIDTRDIMEISERIIKVAQDKEDGMIQTNTISLICTRLYDIVFKKGRQIITLEDVESYLSSNPFEEYYTTAVKNLSENEQRFIECNLVSSDGRRNLLPEKKTKSSFKSFDTLLNSKTAILHRVTLSSGAKFIELIHDGLCNTVLKYRTIRLEKKNKTIMGLWLAIFSLLGLWGLKTVIGNNVISFYYTLIGRMPSLTGLNYISTLAFSELIFLFIFPYAIGSVIYGWKKKEIAYLLLFFYFFPLALFPNSWINYIKEFSIHLSQYYDLYGLDGIIQFVSETVNNWTGSTIVFIGYSFSTTILFIKIFFNKEGDNDSKEFRKTIISIRSVRIYYFVLFSFIFYLFAFNENFNFISQDLLWGLLVIPLLGIILLSDTPICNTTQKKERIKQGSYILLLFVCFFIIGRNQYFSISSLLCCLGISYCLLFNVFFQNNILSAVLKAGFNVIVLAVVLLSCMGYNPLHRYPGELYKVYPWKVLITEENKTMGVYDAIYGDTLFIPKFNKENVEGNTIFYTLLPVNSFTENLRMESGRLPSYFPLKLSRGVMGQWKLSLGFSPHDEYLISRTAHSEVLTLVDSIEKEAAKLFIAIRNDIAKFCLTGKDYILYSDVKKISSYEDLVRLRLNQSLRSISIKRSTLIEEDIVPFLKALTCSFYMNMLKEAILKTNYSDFIMWFGQYYVSTSLETLIHKFRAFGGVNTNGNFVYNLSLDSLEVNNSSQVSSDYNDRQNGKLNAWNNLFFVFFNLEFSTFSSHWAEEINNQVKTFEKSLKIMVEDQNKIAEKLKTYLNKILMFKNQYSKTMINHITDLLTDAINKGDGPTEDLFEQIESYISHSMVKSGDFRNDISQTMGSYVDNASNLTKTLRAKDLLQANIQFENLITDTFNFLIEIIKKDTNNVYNGMFIRLCQELYTIGVIRGYDMGKFEIQMDKIEKSINLPQYEFICKTQAKFKDFTSQMKTFRRTKQNQILEICKVIDMIRSPND